MKQKTDPQESIAEMSRPGAFLKSVREKQAFPRDYLVRQLGLTDTLFNALEADDISRLPNRVFVKGYLRRYAELLGIRVAPILASYQRLLEEKGVVEIEAEPPPERPVMAMAGFALAFLLGTSLVFGAFIADPSGDTSVPSVEAIETVEARVQLPTVQPESSAAKVHLYFSTDSWVEVVDARDHILAVNLQREGTSLELEGQPPFAITLGYGPGVVVSYLGDRVVFESDPETFAANLSVGK